ncbi:MAG: hypothetical protein AB1589_34425 [Cyanobacteriota bacterium]
MDEQLRQRTEHQDLQYEDEIPWKDIASFLVRNGKLLILITVLLSTVSIIFSLLQPKQYQKQLTLLVKSTSISLSNPRIPSPTMDIHQIGAIAVKFLQNVNLQQTTANSKYDPTTQQIDLTLLAPNASALTNAGTKVVNHLEIGLGKILSNSVETSLIATEMELKRSQRILEQLKQQSSQFSPTNESRLGALETQRALQLANIAQLEFDKQYLEQAQKNLAAFTNQVISIQILSESDIPPQSRSLVKVLLIAIIASFLVSVLVVLIRDQILRLKHELAQQKPQGSSSV